MNTRLNKLLASGQVPNRGGYWIDCYNQTCNADVSGTIIAGIFNKNHYFVTEDMKVGRINKGQSGIVYSAENCAPTICATEGVKTNTKIVQPLNEYEEGVARTIKAQYMQTSLANFIRNDGFAATGVVHPVEPTSPDGISPTQNCCGGGGLETKIMIPANTKDGAQMMEIGGVCDLSYPSSKTRRGRVQDNGRVTPTITAHVENCLRRIESGTLVPVQDIEPDYNAMEHYWDEDLQANGKKIPGVKIRKLTERECFRLMDVPDNIIDKIQAAGISRTQQYKMAGNSIVVACLYHIFDKLFVHTEITDRQLTLF